MAVNLSRAGYFSWDKFRAELARAIAQNGQLRLDEHYLRWLDALEASMTGTGADDAEALKARETHYLNHVRDEMF